MSIKIEKEILSSIENEDITKYFGKWINDTESLSDSFITAKPFEHIIIENFLNDEYVEKVYNNFPEDFESKNWHKYYNPIEVKYANDNINILPECISKLFYLLSTKNITDKFREISKIDTLEYDEYLHGAGLHAHPRYGRLNMHLDYEKHPYTGKERRLNVILYLSKDWKKEWKGDTQLWDKDMQQCEKSSPVKFNTAIIFKTNQISWHGLPESIMCPEGTYRKSFAYYYVSPLISEPDSSQAGCVYDGYREKAVFVKRPNDKDYEQLQKLYKIRPYRRIEQSDMDEIWPEWTPKLF